MSGGGTRSGRRNTGGAKMPVQVAATPTTPAPATPAETPQNRVSYAQFIKMSEQEKYDVMERIIDDKNIKVPDYLDKSVTSKIIYALGMNGKPEMVSETEFDKRKGRSIYRTVNNNNAMNMTASDILNQIKTSDYTQVSGDRSSAFGRALYFAST